MTVHRTRQGAPVAPKAPRILLAEDDPDARELLALYLSLEGFEVLPARDGVHALGLLSDDVDAMVADLAMPRMDGATLIERVRAAWQRPFPIVVITGQPWSRRRHLEQVAPCRVFAKPHDVGALALVVRALLSTCTHDCRRCPNQELRERRSLRDDE